MVACYLGDRLEFETRTIRVSPDYVESISRNIPDKLKKRDIIINTNIIVPCLFGWKIERNRMERTFCRWRRRRWWSDFWWRSTCCPVAVPTLPSQRVGGTPRYANASLPRLKGTNKEWVRICCDFLVRGRNKRKRIWFWFYRRRGKPLEKRWGSRSDRKPRRGCLASPPLFFRFYFRSLCVRLIYRS